MPTTLRRHLGAKAAKDLQAALAEMIALSLLSKQAHWNLQGPLFGPLHTFYDQLTDQLRLGYDELAERLVALGYPADGRPATVAGHGAEFPEGFLADRDTVKLVLERLEAAVQRLRGGLAELESEDLATHDLVIGLIQAMEKQAWMLRAQAA